MSVLYPLQHSTPPRRRTAHWVGKPRIRLAERLHAKLSEMGYESEIDCGNIRPQQGAWRTDNRLDVMRVEGSLRMRRDGCWFNFNLESWSTITEMLRHGFSVEVDGFTVSIETEARTPDGYERCGGCGLLTNTAEAACLHCGHTKAWAQPQGEERSDDSGLAAADDNHLPDFSLDTPYVPVAIHYRERDVLEFVERDVPVVEKAFAHASLSVLLDVHTREPVGWRIPGWSSIAPPADDNHKALVEALRADLEQVIHQLDDPYTDGWGDNDALIQGEIERLQNMHRSLAAFQSRQEESR